MSGERTTFIPAVDIPILSELPPEGAMLGRIMPNAMQVRVLRERFDGELTSDILNGRLRSLRFLGYAVDVPMIPAGRGQGWQITHKGQLKLAEEEEGS